MMIKTKLPAGVLFLLLACALAPAAQPNARLFWKNGDVLPGRLLDAKDSDLRWSSQHFTDPLVLELGVLDSVAFDRSAAATKVAGDFRVTTTTGDVWVGDLVAADDMGFTFNSKRFGRVTVKRDAVLSIVRRVHANLVFGGSEGLTGWSAPWTGAPTGLWEMSHGGYPVTRKPGGDLFRKLELPDRVEVDLVLSTSKGRIGFVLGLGHDLTKAARLETWGDEVVLVQGTRFEPVQQLQDEQRSVRLRLRFEQAKGTLAVFDPAGKRLALLAGAKPEGKTAGLYVRNRGADLKIESLRVRRRTETGPAEPVQPNRIRVHTIGGGVVYGELRFDGTQATVVQADQPAKPITLNDVDRIVRPGNGAVAPAGPVHLSYQDGAVIRGAFERVDGGALVVKTAFSTDPVACSLAGASLLRFGPKIASKKPAAGWSDELYCEAGRLRGKLSLDGKDGAPIRWTPTGARNSVRLAGKGKARIVRSKATKGDAFDRAAFADVIHLNNLEVIPCRIESIEADVVHLSSPFVATKQFPLDQVKAIEFSNGQAAGRTGFDDAGWQTLGMAGQAVTHEADRVVLHDRNAGIRHPAILSGSEVRFDLHNINIRSGSLSVSAYTPENDRTRGFTVGFSKDTYYVRHRMPQPQAHKPIRTGGDPVACRIVWGDNQIKFFMNDQLMSSFRLDKTKRPARTLVFKLNYINKTKNEATVGIEIANFEVSGSVAVDADALDRVLTVPRFAKKKPPTHVLMAKTGDLLRGKLVAVGPDVVRFSSKLRQIDVPRSRVAAVVAIAEPEMPAEPDPDGLIRAMLTDGSVLRFAPTRSVDGRLEGTSPVYGKAHLPLKTIRRLNMGDYEQDKLKAPFSGWKTKPITEPRHPQ